MNPSQTSSESHPDAVDWRHENGQLTPYVGKTKVTWTPQPGSQELFLSCPIFECLYEGTRGPGKTDCLLMDFAQHTGPDRRSDEQRKAGVPQTAGFGPEWRGILFRQSFPELADVINKTKKWFPLVCSGVRYNETKSTWIWPTGEMLLFRHGRREDDYWNYHGHAYPWVGFEELTTWADPGFFRKMMSCCRSTHPGVPRKFRATTNPYGCGHNWVKQRYNLPVPDGQSTTDIIEKKGEPPRVAVRGYLDENQILLTADPSYKDRIRAAARNAAEERAWLHGAWDIVAGGMFDDVWEASTHIVPSFRVPPHWRVDRSMDWGSSRPFSIGWWAESDGSDLTLPGGRVVSTVRGDLFRIREWYGWTGEANEGLRLLPTQVTKGIIEREIEWGLHGRVVTGPADSAIFDITGGESIAAQMGKSVRVNGFQHRGIRWNPADKRPGSRKHGWELMRMYMLAATEKTRERPGLFVCENCQQFIRTVPVLPRNLAKDPDDVLDESEDHVGDEARYRVRYSGMRPSFGRTRGT